MGRSANSPEITTEGVKFKYHGDLLASTVRPPGDLDLRITQACRLNSPTL
jgi:hypothetical protein